MKKLWMVLLVASTPAFSDQSQAMAQAERDCRIILIEAERGEYATARRLYSLPPEKIVEMCRDLITLIDMDD